MQQMIGSDGRQRRGGFNPRLLIVVGFIVYAGYFYLSNRSTDPLTGETVLIDRSISPEQESALGLEAYREILASEQPLPRDHPLTREVEAIAARLIAKVPAVEDALAAENGLTAQHIGGTFQWAVTVLQSEQVNAFCLPGGKIAVYTGLAPVAQTRDAMAIVMGHEISHALLRHGAQRMTEQKLARLGQMAGAASGMDAQQMQTIMAVYGYGRQLPYARKQETQADEMGLMLAAAACFDPRESIALWQRMGAASGGQSPPEFSSTHPSSATRIAHLQSLLPKAMAYRQRFCEGAR